jgi:hypothetical protein
VAAGAALCLAPAANAAPRVPTRLFYDGAVCGSAEDFSARVQRRNAAVQFVSSGERLVVRLRIERRDSGLDGRVSISGRGRAPMSRRIQSADCEDALDALALMVAIGIEGRADRAGAPARSGKRAPVREKAPPVAAEPAAAEPTPAPEPAAPAAAPPEPAPPVDPPEPPTPEPITPPASPVAPPPAAAVPAPLPDGPEPGSIEPPGARELTGFTFGVGLSALASVGVTPDPLLGGSLYVVAGWKTHGPWSPELVLGVSHQRRDGVAEVGGDADFALNAANVELCPLRWGFGVFEARPCAAAWFGRLSSKGYETFDPRSTSRPWSTVGASAELNAQLGLLELRASIGAGLPLVRDGFRFGPACSGAGCEADAFHLVAPVIWSLGVGAGARIF